MAQASILKSRILRLLVVVWFVSGAGAGGVGRAMDLLPPGTQLKTDHPRVLLRPSASPWAISLGELRGTGHAGDEELLAQLRREPGASAQAMVWLLTGEASSADRAVAMMCAYRLPEEGDTFHVYHTLTQFAFAYDWLHGYAGFTPAKKAEVRSRVLPLAERGLRFADDHVFHNYIWMSAGGAALWALATAGEDTTSDLLYERVRQRFNAGLFPAWKYLDGLPSEPMGYWALYVLTPGVLTLLGAQSASETDLVGAIRDLDGNWLERHFDNLIHSTLPDLRYVPWGDLQGGPNGGVTLDMAGVVDALTWATRSPRGAYFRDWLARRRGLGRYRGETAVFHFLYRGGRDLEPVPPPLSFLAGGRQGGHFVARSSWGEGETVVAFSATDHFGDHHHYDQGSFMIYRNRLLAVDPPVYRQVRGPQQPTEVHNTLLLDGQGQRPVRGQWFRTVEDFQRNLTAGRQLETGDLLFWREGTTWAAAAAQFAQAYEPTQLRSCVRQFLFVRPGQIVVVDQLVAPPGRPLPAVQWLLQLPSVPALSGRGFWASNGKSWLRGVPLLAPTAEPTVESTAVNTHRLRLRYHGDRTSDLVHLIDVGDGLEPGPEIQAAAYRGDKGIEVTLGELKFRFSTRPPFEVAPSD